MYAAYRREIHGEGRLTDEAVDLAEKNSGRTPLDLFLTRLQSADILRTQSGAPDILLDRILRQLNPQARAGREGREDVIKILESERAKKLHGKVNHRRPRYW